MITMPIITLDDIDSIFRTVIDPYTDRDAQAAAMRGAMQALPMDFGNLSPALIVARDSQEGMFVSDDEMHRGQTLRRKLILFDILQADPRLVFHPADVPVASEGVHVVGCLLTMPDGRLVGDGQMIVITPHNPPVDLNISSTQLFTMDGMGSLLCFEIMQATRSLWQHFATAQQNGM